MILENLLPFLLVCAVLFGVLWLLIETGVMLADLVSNRKRARRTN